MSPSDERTPETERVELVEERVTPGINVGTSEEEEEGTQIHALPTAQVSSLIFKKQTNK